MSPEGNEMDEFELEVTPLGGSSPRVDDPQDVAGTAAHEANHVSTSTVATPAGGTPLRQRKRTLRAGAVTAATLVTLIAVLLVPSGTRSGVLQLLAVATATPTEVVVPGGDLFIWEHTVLWGTLLIDGRQGPDVRGPSVSFDQQGAQGPQIAGFHLSRGRHTLDYRAALFPALHCTVSVPRSTTDTCPLDHQNTGLFILDQPGIRVLDMQATVDRLPAQQAKALAVVTQSALDAAAAAAGPGTIARGDHFLAEDRSTLTADTPLSAQARFSLTDSATLDRSIQFTHCALLCSSDDLFAVSGPETWTVYAPVELSWRYLGADGRVVLDNGPAIAQEARGSVAVAVTARWQKNQWQVQLAPAGPRLHDPVICAVGGHALDVLRISPFENDVSVQIQWSYEASTLGLGCLLTGRRSTVDAPDDPPPPMTLLLYRCGVLLAVNAEAQRIFPHLPHPSANELTLAQAATPPGVTVSP
ncbi:MAG: hypothetical protein ACXWQR_15450 [Ktedonobacterales bacterium]